MIFYLLTLIVTLSVIYHSWFSITKTLSSGDWPYLFLQNIQTFQIPIESPFLWLEPYYQITAKIGVEVFSLSWEITEKIFWFYPFLAISLFSSFIFFKYLAKQLGIDNSLIFVSLGSLIFLTNTYILMLVGGGQMGVAIAYTLVPLVFLRMIKISASKTRGLIFSSLILAVQLMFDPRIFALTIISGFIYLFLFGESKRFDFKIRTIVIVAVSVLINSFWILPNLVFFRSEYTTTANAITSDFLSFANFSNSISLLHPNWPENIFGKIGFMKPEFIVLPILAFGSLLFVKKNKVTLFFAFLGLLGGFFAKGTNPPFGELYRWLSGVPGFMIFRDPTKFYVWVILAYSVLIPFTLLELSKKISSIKYYVLCILFLGFWLILIHPAVFGKLTGTFKPHVVPVEYINLKDFLNKDSENSTLWVPEVERFGFSSKNHPAISSLGFFETNSLSGVLKKIEMPETKSKLKELDIKYVIVPFDYLKEFFLTDRKYDEKLYKQTVAKLKGVTWLSEEKNGKFGMIEVFKVSY